MARQDCPNTPCKADEYSCAGGFQCIRRDWLCDGDMDCPSGDDESEDTCQKRCSEGYFTCADQSCIPDHLRCNKFPECADGSDEVDCGESEKQLNRLDDYFQELNNVLVSVAG